MRKIKIIIGLLAALLLIIPVYAKQNVGFGFSLSGDGTGIFIMLPSTSNVNPEIITSGYIQDEYYNLSLGGRILIDLGSKGIVDRYTGIGAGASFFSEYDFNTDALASRNLVWGQMVLGTKASWNSSFLKAPIKLRSEVALSLNPERIWTHVGFGLEYEF